MDVRGAASGGASEGLAAPRWRGTRILRYRRILKRGLRIPAIAYLRNIP